MDDIGGLPFLEFAERRANVVQDVPVDERDLAIGRGHRDEGGNAVDDLTKRELGVHACLSIPRRFIGMIGVQSPVHHT